MTGTEEEPKLYQHCVALYDKLDSYAEDLSDGRVFVGVVSRIVMDELGLAQSYQSKIVNRLRGMGSISLMKRGGGSASSVWMLHKHPTLDDFFDSDNTGERQKIREQEKHNALQQRVIDLANRIKKIEEWAMDQGAPI